MLWVMEEEHFQNAPVYLKFKTKPKNTRLAKDTSFYWTNEIPLLCLLIFYEL